MSYSNKKRKIYDTVNTKDTDIDGLAELMVGRKVEFSSRKRKNQN